MTFELTLLVWSTLLFWLYIFVQAGFYQKQYGAEFAATGRDNAVAPDARTGRAQRALRNLIETYPVFIVLVVATALGDRSDALTQWGGLIYLVARVAYLPLYLSGIKNLRSLAWIVSFIGLLMMFFGVAF